MPDVAPQVLRPMRLMVDHPFLSDNFLQLASEFLVCVFQRWRHTRLLLGESIMMRSLILRSVSASAADVSLKPQSLLDVPRRPPRKQPLR